MDPINPTPVVPGAPHVSAPAPDVNAGNPPAPVNPTPQATDSMSLAELNQLLGRDFKNRESALKSIKDTFSFATSRITDIVGKVDETTKSELARLANTVESQNKEMWYIRNPQYAPHRQLIDGLGGDPTKVVETQIFKDTFSKLEEHGKTVKLKTVLDSNPRIAASNEGIKKASDMVRANSGIVTKEAEGLAVGAVLDAFNLR